MGGNRTWDRERSRFGVAKQSAIKDAALSQHARYRGFYNMDLARLRELKGVLFHHRDSLLASFSCHARRF